MAIKKEFTPEKDSKIASAELNSNFQQIDNKFRTNIIKDKTGTPRVLIGEQAGGFGGDDYGIKVSQSGNDVTSAADDKLVMSSAFNMFKIIASGTATVENANSANTSYSTTVSHGLSYAPLVIAWCELPSGFSSRLVPVPFMYAEPTTLSTDGTVRMRVGMDVSSSDIVFFVAHDGITSGDFTFKYYVLAETSS